LRKREYLYRDIARQRILLLYRRAVTEAKRGNIKEARRLATLAWDIYKATRVHVPRWFKRGLCRRCHTPLIPGVTARVRLHSQGRFSYVTVTCLLCGWTRRYPYKKRRRTRQVNRGSKLESQRESQAGSSRSG
jgi:ribonuclease P protein subunit RPR2